MLARAEEVSPGGRPGRPPYVVHEIRAPRRGRVPADAGRQGPAVQAAAAGDPRRWLPALCPQLLMPGLHAAPSSKEAPLAWGPWEGLSQFPQDCMFSGSTKAAVVWPPWVKMPVSFPSDFPPVKRRVLEGPGVFLEMLPREREA